MSWGSVRVGTVRSRLVRGQLPPGWSGSSLFWPERSGPRSEPECLEVLSGLQRPGGELAPQRGHHVRDRQWSEAIKIYQRVIEQFGDKVAKLPKDEPGTDPSGDFVLYVDDRRFCHRCLAQLPPEAREIYRNRVDGVAERWFRQGASQRDVGSLRRVVDQAFCSSWGDDALELLGDLAFQDGRFGEALAMYSRLVADRPDDPFVLVHPDPSVDLARVAAKKLLCRAAEGENPPARPSSTNSPGVIRRRPAALAGRKGPYAQDPRRILGVRSSGPARLSPTAVGRLSPVRSGGRRSSPDRSTSARCNGASSSRRSH